MAYVNQEMKKTLAPGIKAVLKKYGVKGTLAVRNHSTLVCNIKSGRLDFLGACPSAREYNRDYIDVNPYWIDKHFEDGEVVNFLTELKAAMEGPDFFCEDDAMTDYFHRSHYIDINVGDWNKPYQLEA